MQHIIDSHTHFWHPEQLSYSWLERIPTINHVYTPADLPSSGDDWVMDALVFVEADIQPKYALSEAEWVASLAKADPRLQGIIAFAPLHEGDTARDYLDQLKAIPLLKGVRRLIQSEPLGFSLQPQFVAGVKCLREYDLTFDLCVYHHQLPDIIELVRQCPDIQFVLDHVGKPGIKDGLLAPWREHIKTLSGFSNVCCKISGVVTEAGANWQPQQLQPYIDHVLEYFGIDRVMYGGDWPVVLLASTYEQWIQTVLNATQSLTQTERDKFFYSNAKTFYRLNPIASH